MYYTCTKTRKTEKAERPKGVNLKVRWRAKVAMRYCSEESARRAILVWECCDRPPKRSVGKGACVCSCGYDDPTPRTHDFFYFSKTIRRHRNKCASGLFLAGISTQNSDLVCTSPVSALVQIEIQGNARSEINRTLGMSGRTSRT